jgi:hypothetical protein
MVCTGYPPGKGGTGGRKRSAAEGEHRTGEDDDGVNPCLAGSLCYASERGGLKGRFNVLKTEGKGWSATMFFPQHHHHSARLRPGALSPQRGAVQIFKVLKLL